MSAIELLTELAAVGATIRRLPGDRLKIGGKLSPELTDRLRDAKPELLALLPDPADAMRREWANAVDQANELLDSSWYGTAEQSAELSAIEGCHSEAVAAGDSQTAANAARDYVVLAQRFRLWEDAMRWPDVVTFRPLCKNCGFDSGTNSSQCQVCVRHERDDAERVHHKSRDCTSTNSWQHTFGKRYCADCWPCTDEAMRSQEGSGQEKHGDAQND